MIILITCTGVKGWFARLDSGSGSLIPMQANLQRLVTLEGDSGNLIPRHISSLFSM